MYTYHVQDKKQGRVQQHHQCRHNRLAVQCMSISPFCGEAPDSSSWCSWAQVGGERDHGFDRARYEQLLLEIRRYRGYLRASADNTRDAPDAVAHGDSEGNGDLKLAR